MKKLVDYKKEIHTCSKCGLCQSVCPVYKVTGNDCTVSRGKFIMLNGIIKGDLKLNKNINKYLDMCLKCNACKNFCPSEIDARKIFLTAKAEYFECLDNRVNSKFVKILNSPQIFNLFMNSIKFATSMYRFLRFDKVLKHFYPILQKFELGKKLILMNKFIMINVVGQVCPTYFQDCGRRSGIPARQQKDLKVVYFKGCVNEYINPRVKIATENILKQMNIEILPINFQCCGVPFLSGGNVEQFIKQAELNLAKIPDEFDYFLTDCASCQNAFKEYENYIDDEKLLKKLEKINAKSINIVDFVIKNVKSFEFSEKTTFTFHKPCHLENMSFLQEFLAKAKNVEYVEMKDFDVCCGFSGEFAMKNPEISTQISVQKAQNALETKADYILTSCPACVLGLNQGLIEKDEREQGTRNRKQNVQNKIAIHSPSFHSSPFTLHFIEFLSKAQIKL